MTTQSEMEMLFPKLIDHRATVTPTKIFAYLPKSEHLEDCFFPLTYSALAKAVDAAALWLDEELHDVEKGSIGTVPYIGANDFRYVLLLFASIKSGRCLMTPLTFNTTEGLVKLLADCKTVFTCRGYYHHWAGAKAEIPGLRVVEVPSLATFIHEDEVAKYPYVKKYAESVDDVVYKIQTSRTTGSPKLLEYPMREMLTVPIAQFNQEAGENEKLVMPELFGNGCYTPIVLPLSWGAGMLLSATFPLGINNVPIMLPSTAPQPMTPEYVIRLIQTAPRGARNGLTWVPSGLRPLVREPAGLKSLQHFDWVGYAGAPLDHATGDMIARFTRVQSLIGDTNLGLTPLLLNEPSDWKMHRISGYTGFFLDKFADGLYELCVRRQPQDGRPCFTREPASEVYHTRDLWKQVEGRPGFWETAGRMDDFVKLSSMTKFNAMQLEQKLESHPGVVRALVAGDGRPRPFAIVELDTTSTRDAAIEALAVANANVWEEVQLSADLLIVADDARPIKRTDKGSTDRRNTIAMYAGDIDALYRKAA